MPPADDSAAAPSPCCQADATDDVAAATRKTAVAVVQASKAAEAAASRCRKLQAMLDGGDAGGPCIAERSRDHTTALASQYSQAASLCQKDVSCRGRLGSAARSLADVVAALGEASSPAHQSLAAEVLRASAEEEERALITLRRDVASAQAELCVEEAKVVALRKAVAASQSTPATASSASVDDAELLQLVTREHDAAFANLAEARSKAVQKEREVSHLLSAREFARGFLVSEPEQLPDRHVHLQKSLRRMQGDVTALRASCAEGAQHVANAEARSRFAQTELKVERKIRGIAAMKDEAFAQLADNAQKRAVQNQEIVAMAKRVAHHVTNYEEHAAEDTLSLARIALVAAGAAPVTRLLKE